MSALIAQAFPNHAPLDVDLAAEVEHVLLTPHEFLMIVRDAGLERLMARADKAEQTRGRPARLDCFARAAELAAAYDAISHGHQPDDWTRPALCTRCGPIWVRPGFVEHDWQVIDVCPYARVTAPPQGYARPHVRCGDCKFFQPFEGGSGELGCCTALNGVVGRNTRRWCAEFRPRDNEREA